MYDNMYDMWYNIEKMYTNVYILNKFIYQRLLPLKLMKTNQGTCNCK